MEIKYYNNETKKDETELVYGASGVQFLYTTFIGQILSNILEYKLISKIYGLTQSLAISRNKILPFIKKFNIQINQFDKELSNDEIGFSSFNHFFVRKFKPNLRPFPKEENKLGAFCEARYFAHDSISDEIIYPVKGKYIKPVDLLGSDKKNEKWSHLFNKGSFIIARLCPVDYHRFHFPDDGEVLDFYKIHNKLISVNPIALKTKPDTFIKNERNITILQTKHFGKLAYIEVGAICVGKIVQSFIPTIGAKFKRGQEKGYFLFGGSTVIVLAEKNQLILNNEMLLRSQKGIETYFQLGSNLSATN